MHSKLLHTFTLFALGTALAVTSSAQAATAEQALESKVKQSIDRKGSFNESKVTGEIAN